MSSHAVSKLLALSLAALMTSGMISEPTETRLQLVREGRFTYFADLDSVSHDGNFARVRSLQLTDEPMVISSKSYIGGYSWWRFDCVRKTAQRLDYASLSEDTVVGPVTPINGTEIDLAPGGEAAELAAVACGFVEPRVDASTLAQAIALSLDKTD